MGAITHPGICYPPRLGSALGSVDINIPGAITSGITGIAAGFSAAGAIAAGASFGSVVPVIGTAIGAIIGLAMNFLHAGYNPRKLNDTAVTEAVQLALHQTWYQLTGEDLGGVATPCVPGQCGSQHVAIFTTSEYPNVPLGQFGNPEGDIEGIILKAQELIAQGRSRLIRQESFADYEANTNYMLGLFGDIARNRSLAAADAAANALADPFANVSQAFSGLPWWAPWAAGAGLLWLVI